MANKQNQYLDIPKLEVPYIEDADELRPAAVKFEKNGYYTTYPIGTTGYKKFWDEELRRCIFGYTAPSGMYITGYNYFYLNYSRIIRTEERWIKYKNGHKRKIISRVEGFPRVYDYDIAYFNTIEKAEEIGKHLVTIKKRGSGYSFKGASMMVRNFYCIPHSRSIAVAAESEYLTKDGLLSKAWEMMSFIDNNTAFAKKRQKFDTKTHKRASFIKEDVTYGVKSEVGWGSEIMAVTLKNDVQKIRGKRAKLILFEEAGNFPGLKAAWQIARPSVEDNNIAFGLLLAYGTGGTVGASYEGLKDLFYEPVAYNAVTINNEWDEGADGAACGFFVPQYYNMEGNDKEGLVEKGARFMDKNGNSNVILSINYESKKRLEIINNATDKTTIDRYIAEKPFTPQEAVLVLSGNVFPKQTLIEHLANIRNNEKIKAFKQVGDLYIGSDNTIKWHIDASYKDLTSYRLTRGDDKKGAIVIWEHPVDNPPPFLYVMGIDPYDFDSSTTKSLGSCFVYKRFQDFESYYDLPVAEYTGRPDTADEFYEKTRLLALYYNATILYENEKKGLFDYFKRKNSEYLLADQPSIIKDIIADSKVSRLKGIHMNKYIKEWMIGSINEWLREEYAPGHMNLEKLYSEPLLEELIAYNDDGNFDRVIAFGMCMIYIKELHSIVIKNRQDESKSNFIGGALFKSTSKHDPLDNRRHSLINIKT